MHAAQEIANWKKHKAKRSKWDSYWQELADVLHPVRADITSQTNPGEDRNNIIFDGAPMIARRSLANTLDGLLKPKTSKWFSMVPESSGLADSDEVKRWVDTVVDTMWREIYSKNARFIQRSGEVDNDLVTFGIGYLFIGERDDLSGLKFQSVHPKQVSIVENSDGVIDTVYYEFPLSARQALQKFGEDGLPKEIRDALQSGEESDKTFQFLQVIKPRTDRDTGSAGADNLPFASATFAVNDKKLMEETGFHEFPFAIPRWDTATGEIYPRSPGMMALPGAKTLQAMGKTLLVAGQKAVDPPMWALDEAVIGVPRTFPGGMTIIDSEAARNNQQPFGVLNTGANMPLGLEMQNRTRQEVEAAFFRNVFNLPIDGPQMTATEVIQRREELVREIGPVFGRLETDYVGHTVERVFGILSRAGAFPPPPEELIGQEVKFEFQSPIQQARKQIEALSIANAVEALRPIVEFQPEVMDNFDGDEIMRDAPESFGVPPKWLRTRESVQEIRQGRAEAQAQQEALAHAEQAASVAQKVAE